MLLNLSNFVLDNNWGLWLVVGYLGAVMGLGWFVTLIVLALIIEAVAVRYLESVSALDIASRSALAAAEAE